MTTPLLTMLRPHFHTISAVTISYPNLTFNTTTTPAIKNMTPPSAPVDFYRHSPAVRVVILLRKETGTFLPPKVRFGGNQPYERQLSRTNLCLSLPPPPSWH